MPTVQAFSPPFQPRSPAQVNYEIITEDRQPEPVWDIFVQFYGDTKRQKRHIFTLGH